MRFFESLAAEASLDKQMEGERSTAPAPAPPAPPVPVGSPERAPAAAPPSDVIRQMFAPSAPPSATAPTAAEPSSSPVSVRSDAFRGDEILELPSLEPIIPPGPAHLNNVLEIEFPSDHVTQPMASQPPPQEPAARTAAFASEKPASPFPTPPPPPEPETPRSTLGLASPFTAASEIAPGETEETTAPTTPRLAPPPRPIVLPSRTPSIAPLAASGGETASVEPFAPAPSVGAETAPIEPFAPAQTASASAFGQAAGTAAASANRQTPAEMAQAYVTSWVSPEVEEPRRSRRRIGPLTLLALLVAIAILVVVWKFGLDGRFPGSTAQKAPQPQQTGPAHTAPAATPSKTPSETGAPAAAATTQPPAPEAETAKAPSGSGGYTIQLRSSPNEADSAAYVTALKGAGFDAYVMRADLGARGTWYRVRVGRYDSRTEAQQSLGKLRSSGHGGDAIIQQYEAP